MIITKKAINIVKTYEDFTMRKTRILKKGASYHITSLINRKERIFEDKLTKQLFIDILIRAKKKFKFNIINFCIMHNHIHLI
jgi:REP element-mobilizing transposase RayT